MALLATVTVSLVLFEISTSVIIVSLLYRMTFGTATLGETLELFLRPSSLPLQPFSAASEDSSIVFEAQTSCLWGPPWGPVSLLCRSYRTEQGRRPFTAELTRDLYLKKLFGLREPLIMQHGQRRDEWTAWPSNWRKIRNMATYVKLSWEFLCFLFLSFPFRHTNKSFGPLRNLVMDE